MDQELVGFNDTVARAPINIDSVPQDVALVIVNYIQSWATRTARERGRM